MKETLHRIVDELVGSTNHQFQIAGFVVRAIPWLKSLFVGVSAPFRVFQDSIKLLGEGTVPCITLILGGNLTQGLRKSQIKPVVVFAILCVRFAILPDCCGKSSLRIRIRAIRSIVPIRADDTVYCPTCHEYR
ncbi:Membrane transport protein [Musa troglodytarum]|uniref:Membrane transport protein n=1 Tax=Musa troglodytarum TaxID=320322 RepID=A0A9E7GUC2_9LILI|nr:Membrane transport protein [Musa troglodytarum]